MKPKIVVVNINDTIPDLSSDFEILEMVDILYADALVLAHDVSGIHQEMCATARAYGIPSFIMQHGRFAASDYAYNGKEPAGDYFFAWGAGDVEMAIEGGWKPEQVIQVGAAQLHERVKAKPDGKTVVFAPVHLESLNSINKRNKTSAKDVWEKLCKIKDINPIAKLLDGEHLLEDFTGGTVCLTNRQDKGQAKKIFKLLSKASCVVSQIEGTFELFAYAMDIPVVHVKGSYTSDDAERWHSAANLVSFEGMEDAILDAIDNPEINRKERADIVKKDGGKPSLNTKKLMVKAIKKRIRGVNPILKNKKPEITCFLREKDAQAFYRMSLPLSKINHAGNFNVKEIFKGEDSGKILNGLKADLLVLPAVGEAKLLDCAAKMKQLKKKIVLDFDENVFAPSPLSPRYQRLGRQGVDIGGKPAWVDGKNINLFTNKIYVENIEMSLELADMVTVSSESLKEVYEKYNNNVRVVPTCIDASTWKKLPLERNTDIRVGWHGSWASAEDVGVIEKVLPDLLIKYPMMKIVLLGYHPEIPGIPEDRIERHPWVPIDALPYKMAALNLDIGLLPSINEPHAVFKGINKWLEYAALEVPTVCSFVPPYTSIANNDNGVYIDKNDPDGWAHGISLLAEDTILAAKMAGAARRIVENDYDINKHYTRWQDIYREVM